ncbi:hypothetical protein CTI12_AA507600 [Artemisia annua]|uniref:Uncharacterized protein n=1 Tax=Artemisia annua TaxID=35608 RepID=A0A2U1LC16_ARTAN|nr:hypothetical protein CTI12_AA507600 [Artemisia annua]
MASSSSNSESNNREPNISELKEACGSGDLATCFKFLFNSEIPEEYGFLVRMGEERNQLLSKVQKLEVTIRETRFRGPFNDKAVDALRCLIETHQRLLDRVQVLTTLIDEVPDGIVEKGRHVKLMEFDEGLSDLLVEFGAGFSWDLKPKEYRHNQPTLGWFKELVQGVCSWVGSGSVGGFSGLVQ